MPLTTYFQWGLQLQQNRLLEEEFPGLETESSHLGLSHLDCLAGPASSHCNEKFQVRKYFNISVTQRKGNQQRSTNGKSNLKVII